MQHINDPCWGFSLCGLKSLTSFFPGLLWSDSPCLLCLWTSYCGLLRSRGLAKTPSGKKTAVCKSRKYDIRTHVPLKSRSPCCCSFGLSIRNVCYAKEWLPSQMPTRDRHLFFLFLQLHKQLHLWPCILMSLCFQAQHRDFIFIDAILSIVSPC